VDGHAEQQRGIVSAVELSVVVPVYNEAGNIPEFLRRVVPILRENTESYEVIFSVDPSRDGTENVIREARKQDPAVKLLLFSRRFGQPTATLAGIEFASGRAVVVMDVDLQDPPELVPQMLARWRDGYEVVYAQRSGRQGESFVKRRISTFGYNLIDRYGEVHIPRETGDFRLMDRRVVDQLARFPEAHGFLRGMVALVGFKQTAVVFERPARFAGKGNYNRFTGSLRIGLNGLVAFSSVLLSLSTILGVASVGIGVVLGLICLITAIAGASFPIAATTIVMAVLIVGGLVLVCLGILGQYVGRIYDEVKRRPRYIVDVAEGFVDEPADLPLRQA
jgi:dolichol-phosphate mannosyltransferase